MVTVYRLGAGRTSILRCLGDLGDGGWEDCRIGAGRLKPGPPSAKHSVKDGMRAVGCGLGAAGQALIS